MNTTVLKNKIHSLVENADEKVLTIVNSVFENYYNQNSVAFHPDGKLMTKQEYKEALQIAEQQILKGDFMDVEDMN
jgi:rRNA pseudouridine-1189 N-methylase Emg1 (Nep1/Mra1 family)